jgi:hypothetical protein
MHSHGAMSPSSVSRQDAGAALAVESWHWGRTGAKYLSFANPHACAKKCCSLGKENISHAE